MDEQKVLKRFESAGGGPTRAKLIDRLKTGKIGDVLTDEDLSALCGHQTSPGGSGYHPLRSAIYYVVKHYKVVWQRIRDTRTIKCLDTDGIVNVADKSASKVHRESKRTLLKLQSVDLSTVETVNRPAVLCRLAQHGTMVQFSGTATRKKFEARNVSQPVDLTRLLEVLK